MWRGWTKNLYLLYESSARRVLGEVAELLIADVLPVAVFLALAMAFALGFGGEKTGLALTMCFLLVLIRQGRYARAIGGLGYDARIAPYFFLGAGLLALLLLNSARAHRWSGRVDWKGRDYATRRKR
jgi:hypothetical protein